MKQYFTSSNSGHGYVSLQAENLTGIEKIYYLKGPCPVLIDVLLGRVLAGMRAGNQSQVERIYNPFHLDLLAGLVDREVGVAFISEMPVPSNAEVIDLKVLYDGSTLKKKKEALDRLDYDIESFKSQLYMHYRATILVHDEREKVYIDRLDKARAQTFMDDFLARELHLPQLTRQATVVRRFFGASSPPEGIKDFVQVLTAGMKRYFIKGRPGTGKSTLLRAIAKKCEDYGYDLEIYHCSLDPSSLDMVIIPAIGKAFFDATAPHEYEPTETSDEVIDTYSLFVKPLTDSWLPVIAEIEERYKNQIKKGLQALQSASQLMEAKSKIYQEALLLHEVKGVEDYLHSLFGQTIF